MDKWDWMFLRGMIYMALTVLVVCGSITALQGMGDTEVTGLVTSTAYGSWPWEHTKVTFVQCAPEGVILDETFRRMFAGHLDLELGRVYRISSHKDFFQLWRLPTEIVRVEAG